MCAMMVLHDWSTIHSHMMKPYKFERVIRSKFFTQFLVLFTRKKWWWIIDMFKFEGLHCVQTCHVTCRQDLNMSPTCIPTKLYVHQTSNLMSQHFFLSATQSPSNLIVSFICAFFTRWCHKRKIACVNGTIKFEGLHHVWLMMVSNLCCHPHMCEDVCAILCAFTHIQMKNGCWQELKEKIPCLRSSQKQWQQFKNVWWMQSFRHDIEFHDVKFHAAVALSQLIVLCDINSTCQAVEHWLSDAVFCLIWCHIQGLCHCFLLHCQKVLLLWMSVACLILELVSEIWMVWKHPNHPIMLLSMGRCNWQIQNLLVAITAELVEHDWNSSIEWNCFLLHLQCFENLQCPFMQHEDSENVDTKSFWWILDPSFHDLTIFHFLTVFSVSKNWTSGVNSFHFFTAPQMNIERETETPFFKKLVKFEHPNSGKSAEKWLENPMGAKHHWKGLKRFIDKNEWWQQQATVLPCHENVLCHVHKLPQAKNWNFPHLLCHPHRLCHLWRAQFTWEETNQFLLLCLLPHLPPLALPIKLTHPQL